MAIKNNKVKPDNTMRGSVILFSNNNYPKVFDHNHDNLMVITTTIHNYATKKIRVDQGGLVGILYSAIVATMKIHKEDLKPYTGNLIRFINK